MKTMRELNIELLEKSKKLNEVQMELKEFREFLKIIEERKDCIYVELFKLLESLGSVGGRDGGYRAASRILEKLDLLTEQL